MALEFKEKWPKAADSVDVADGTLYVYKTRAMFQPSGESSDGYEAPSYEVWMDPSEIDDMREALKWAKRRLAGRS